MERSADNRIRTTEWEDVQYKFGNKVGKYASHELEILAQGIADANENTCLKPYDREAERVEDKMERGGYEFAEGREGDPEAVLDPDDDDDALAAIRRRRLAEMQRQKEQERFGVLRHVPGSDYVKEVTDASESNHVVAVLIKPGDSNCEAMLSVMRSVAQRHRDVKFVSMVSTEAIPSFPDKHLPCVLLYRSKALKNQVTGLDAWKAKNQLSIHTVERMLRLNGVLPQEDEEEDE